MLLLARATPCVMPSGSPSPPYKDNPTLVWQERVFSQIANPIGGIKREAYFRHVGYKIELL